ncbi:transposase [Leptolyngbya sp. CCY15150]|uniref:transposase n=1 Tax=Leptolyngbya sp. CCY15150 TaxID=2767772 RepID=UPI001950B3B3|nr:transposase [Leptolyngbya sp. CCY15150]
MTQEQISPPQMGHFYHIYNRGNNRQNVFFERDNYLYFLRLIRQTFVTHNIDMVAYCLMPNHYHLLVYPKSAHLSQSMKSLSLSYTKAINKRFGRVGALFQGRFQRILVTHSDYLVHLIRYIHQNPVKANLVSQPEEWEFSSYLDYAGLRAGTLPNLALLQQQFEESDRLSFWANGCLPTHLAFRQLLPDE